MRHLSAFPATVALAALVLLPLGARGQDPAASRVDPAVWTVVEPILAAAVRDSLPVEALRSKALEGAAKRVAPERIRGVVQGLADEFRTARSALRAATPAMPLADGEVVAAAMAVRQGIPMAAVLRVWEARPPEGGESLEVPLVVMAEIVRRGVAVPEAEALMGHVVATGVPMQVAAQLPGRMDGMLASGTPPGQAVAAAARALKIPRPPGRGPRR